MDRADLREIVRTIMDEPYPTATWSNEMLNIHIKNAYSFVCNKVRSANGKYYFSESSISTVSGTRNYDLLSDCIASNIINVSDIEHISGLIGLLVYYGGEVYIVTRKPLDLEQTTISISFIKKQVRILQQLHEKGCKIRFNSRLHAKATVTSQGAVSGSFNLTASGRFYNLEEGHFFPNVNGESKKHYDDILLWVKDLFKNRSKELSESDLSI